ncbi:hypothetical protein HPB49_024593 [Dermacentor silvarum]|uniref:Uncharacterized protein n=1 Tax=Dermacentor silvarum TaxID=543639 RepID=A0ACB8CIH4_DERSI|nr:hypothetical protein HPB49_024593 [Dermacentor silvarum]
MLTFVALNYVSASSRPSPPLTTGAVDPEPCLNITSRPPREVTRQPTLLPLCSSCRPTQPLARFVLAISRLRPLCFPDRRVDADACPPDEVACPQCPNGFTADYLREELARRNLDTTGSKKEIINRLIANIAQNRPTTPPLPSPDSAASTQRCNVTPLPPSLDAAQTTELLTAHRVGLQGIADANLATTIAAQRPETVAAHMDIVTQLDQTLSHSFLRAPHRVSKRQINNAKPTAPPPDQREARSRLSMVLLPTVLARTWPKLCVFSAVKGDLSHSCVRLDLRLQRLQHIFRLLSTAALPRPETS